MSLEGLLAEIRLSLGADTALILYRHRDEKDARALASSSKGSHALPLCNEPLRLGPWSSDSRPSAHSDLVMASTLTQFQTSLRSALVIPWTHPWGHGWLVAGVASSERLDVEAARRWAEEARRAHVVAGLRGASRLHQEIAKAADRIAEAAVGAEDVAGLLGAIAATARTLLGTAVSYISVADDSGRFSMSTLLNVRTRAFRHLCLESWQGLGGLAYERMQPVISCNYAEDRRLADPPVAETLEEGLRSAICVPLVVSGEVTALLYTANRRLTAFTPADAALLAELAQYAARGLERSAAERYRRAELRRLERERLMFALHDSVVRSLIDIGYEAENGVASSGAPEVADRLERIGRAAEECLEEMRQRLADLDALRSSDGETAQSHGMSAAAIADALRATRTRSLRSSVRVVDDGSAGMLAPIATAALLTVGREAIRNADLHSGGSSVHVTLEITERKARLQATDDGSALATSFVPGDLARSSGHLGLMQMRRATEAAGGSLLLYPTQRGGLCVESVLPLP